MSKYLITIATFLSGFVANAQIGFVATGGDAASGSGSVSYSVGQIDYTAYAGSSNIIIEGLQQPQEISAPLPITLLYFSAKAEDNHTVNLNWSTVSEHNSDYFIIERSADGRSFTKFGTKPAVGNSTQKLDYATMDKKPFDGYNYYRLKLVDMDGSITMSQIEEVYLGNTKMPPSIYPNPAKDLIYLKINDKLQDNLSYQIFDLNGRLIFKEKISQNLTPIILTGVASGSYILHVMQAGQSIQKFKIVKLE